MTTDFNTTLSIFQILGGVALFLYGIRKVTKSLEDFAGASLRMVITRISESRFRGFAIGVLVALTLQSSAAVMLMMVALANNGLVMLVNAASIILGAGVGSTLTVQLLAFRIQNWAPALLLIGFIMMRFTRAVRIHDIGGAIFSFGLVFLGMTLITGGSGSLLNDGAQVVIGFFSRTPFFAAVTAAILTILFQSSAATLGLLLTLSFSGLINCAEALPFIVGANIGSCGIAFIGAMGGGAGGKRIAWTELIVRSVAGIIVFMLADYYIGLAGKFGESAAREIANLHTMFALTAAVIFLPFNKPLARAVSRLVPASEADLPFSPKYLDPNSLKNPSLALGCAAREILRQGDIVLSLMDDIYIALEHRDRPLLEDIIARDDLVDIEQEAITIYLTKLSGSELSVKESRTELELLTITLELEHIADVISKNLADNTNKLIEGGFYFSDEGLEEIKDFHHRIRNLLVKALDTAALREPENSESIIVETKTIVQEQRRLNKSHIERLHSGVKFSTESSAIHLDLISDLTQIAIHISYIAYAISGKV